MIVGDFDLGEVERVAELVAEVLDDRVAVAEEVDVKVGVGDGIAVDEDLGHRVREVACESPRDQYLCVATMRTGIDALTI